jgi:Xaa-Pro dipeptidase
MTTPPFQTEKADALMEAHGLDVLIANSPHNVRYLLGGHRSFFFQSMDALGHARYLPLVIYVAGTLDQAAYIASAIEGFEKALGAFWPIHTHTVTWGTRDAAEAAVKHLTDMGLTKARIGIEPPFLPRDADQVLADGLPDAIFGDATPILERLRAIKRPDELTKLSAASDGVIDAMRATIDWATPGVTKHQIIHRLKAEEHARDLGFDYCLVTFGQNRNRAPSDQQWQPGEAMSIDSGGNIDGYIGDLCRMAVMGPPDAELEDLLAEVDATQQATFSFLKAGATGQTALDHGNSVLKSGPNAKHTDLVIHGMGLVSHEVPFIMSNRIYDGVDAEVPLEAGMVVSVETTMGHPDRGLIKLEDTIAITEQGFEMYGDAARGWNIA